MKILLASSEVVPFAKTGGLADVCGALPTEIQKLGHEVAVFMPAYQACENAGIAQEDTGIRIPITVGSKIVEGALWKSHLPQSDVVVYLVHQAEYFDRAGLYQDSGEDYKDNCERFVFFCRFILESLEHLNWFPDVLHANDWQTG
ncbi:MAG: glycogen/starch synthase, partial [Pirellulaceae bacterium]|nr:glycogen/starch synthase [Pirellulaceae bacterium]